MIIDNDLHDKVTAKAIVSPRLRMNYNIHGSLDEKCHRFLNTVEPGTVVPIHDSVTAQIEEIKSQKKYHDSAVLIETNDICEVC